METTALTNAGQRTSLALFAMSALVAAAAGESTSAVADPPKDGRVTYQEFLASGDNLTGDPELTAAIKKVAAATVRITNVYDENGNSLWNDHVDHLGSGTVTGNRCYVLTSRHVINKFKVDKDGELVVDNSIDPKGYRVEMLPALSVDGSQQAREKMKGTVIRVLGETTAPDTDVAIIRLDRSSGMPSVRMGAVNALNKDKFLAAHVGFPDDFQSKDGVGALVVNPKFMGSAGKYYLATDLYTSSGASGGAIIAKDSQNGSYEFVGFAWSVSNGEFIVGRSEKVVAYGKVLGTSNANITSAVKAVVMEDMKSHPCKP